MATTQGTPTPTSAAVPSNTNSIATPPTGPHLTGPTPAQGATPAPDPSTPKPATTTPGPTSNPSATQSDVPAGPSKAPTPEQSHPQQRTAAQILQSQIDALTEFTSRVRALRQSPSTLLRAGGSSFEIASTAKAGFAELKGARERLLQDQVQGALKAALESERKDRSSIRGGLRREVRKRRRSPSPESPKPYVPPKSRSLFPTANPPHAPPTVATLPDFIRAFNASQGRKVSMHVCLSSDGAPREVVPPVLVRFAIADVLKAYLTLDVASDAEGDTPARERDLLIENVAVFGSREKQPPHSQSAFQVFQRMSQEIVRMIQAVPRVPLRTLADMLVTYQDVFTTKCVSCERVLAAEGYLPPIARVWREDEEGHGTWEARHVSCTAIRH